MLKFEKVKSLVAPVAGWYDAGFFYVVFNGTKRVGTIDKLRDGYAYHEDFKKGVHSRENRPFRSNGKTLKELKAKVSAYYEG